MRMTEMTTTRGDNSTSEPRRRSTFDDSDDVGLILLNHLTQTSTATDNKLVTCKASIFSLKTNQKMIFNSIHKWRHHLTRKFKECKLCQGTAVLCCGQWAQQHISYKMPCVLRPLQYRPLVSDIISYIKCPSPNVKESEKLILDQHPDPDQNQKLITSRCRPVANLLITEGLFPQILDLFQGLKIGVPRGCLGETSIFKIMIDDVTL